MKEAKSGKYSEEIKAEAKALFLKGLNYYDVAEKVREATGRVGNASLIKFWSDKGNWVAERHKLIKKMDQEVMHSTEENLLIRIKEQLDAYKGMTEMGLEAIKDKSVTVDKVSEAVELIDKGIRGERLVSSGLVSWRYIEQVVHIIIEEVKDDETKKRIANKLRRLTEDILSL